VALVCAAAVNSPTAGHRGQQSLTLTTATPAQVELGRTLFSDTRLSADKKVGCITCHVPERAFADGRRVAIGAYGRSGTRNTPTLVNAGFAGAMFWEGRRSSLEEQIPDPFFNSMEHALEDEAALLTIVRANQRYPALFRRAFGDNKTELISMRRVVVAIAAYVRSLDHEDSPFDRFYYRSEKGALTESQQRGLRLFQGRARCTECHLIGRESAPLTDDSFHPTQLPKAIAADLARLTRLLEDTPPARRGELISRDAGVAALGRFAATLDPRDIGRFKTPSLRNVALTAPYLHDGSASTLAEAILFEIYARTGKARRAPILTPSEVSDLAAFLASLTSAAQTADSRDER
jgi:cytochrome c peroxidase